MSNTNDPRDDAMREIEAALEHYAMACIDEIGDGTPECYERTNAVKGQLLALIRAKPPQPDADGWINPNDKTQKQYLPHIGEKVLFCHAGVTHYGQHTGGSFQSLTHPRRLFNTWDCLWMYPPKAKDVQS